MLRKQVLDKLEDIINELDSECLEKIIGCENLRSDFRHFQRFFKSLSILEKKRQVQEFITKVREGVNSGERPNENYTDATKSKNLLEHRVAGLKFVCHLTYYVEQIDLGGKVAQAEDPQIKIEELFLTELVKYLQVLLENNKQPRALDINRFDYYLGRSAAILDSLPKEHSGALYVDIYELFYKGDSYFPLLDYLKKIPKKHLPLIISRYVAKLENFDRLLIRNHLTVFITVFKAAAGAETGKIIYDNLFFFNNLTHHLTAKELSDFMKGVSYPDGCSIFKSILLAGGEYADCLPKFLAEMQSYRQEIKWILCEALTRGDFKTARTILNDNKVSHGIVQLENAQKHSHNAGKFFTQEKSHHQVTNFTDGISISVDELMSYMQLKYDHSKEKVFFLKNLNQYVEELYKVGLINEKKSFYKEVADHFKISAQYMLEQLLQGQAELMRKVTELTDEVRQLKSELQEARSLDAAKRNQGTLSI